MKLSIRSKVLIAIGTLVYGTPKSFGAPCSAAEFYAMPNERPEVNPKDFHPSNVGLGPTMRRNIYVDCIRRRVFKHMALISFAGSLLIFTGGSLLTQGVIKAKSVVSSVSSNMDTKAAKNKRIEEIKREAESITLDANNGKITREEYETKAKALEQEYKNIKESL